MAKQKTTVNPLFQQVAVLQQATAQIQETLSKISGKTEPKTEGKMTVAKAKELIEKKNKICEEYGYSWEYAGLHGDLVLAKRVNSEGVKRKNATVFNLTHNGKLMKNKLFKCRNGKVVRA